MTDKIQLYSLATPNGQKVGIALEEMEIPYDAHTIDIMKGDQFTPEFIKINPNSKIPAIVDPTGADGKPLAIMESGAILMHLAEKAKRFFPTDARLRSETLQWLFFQVGGVGPMFGQFGHFFKYAKDKCDHPYPVKRYSDEAKRLLKVLEERMKDRKYIVGDDYSIADMAIVPWIMALRSAYGADEALELAQFSAVGDWCDRVWERPLTLKGSKVCPFN